MCILPADWLAGRIERKFWVKSVFDPEEKPLVGQTFTLAGNGHFRAID